MAKISEEFDPQARYYGKEIREEYEQTAEEDADDAERQLFRDPSTMTRRERFFDMMREVHQRACRTLHQESIEDLIN